MKYVKSSIQYLEMYRLFVFLDKFPLCGVKEKMHNTETFQKH